MVSGRDTTGVEEQGTFSWGCPGNRREPVVSSDEVSGEDSEIGIQYAV